MQIPTFPRFAFFSETVNRFKPKGMTAFSTLFVCAVFSQPGFARLGTYSTDFESAPMPIPPGTADIGDGWRNFIRQFEAGDAFAGGYTYLGNSNAPAAGPQVSFIVSDLSKHLRVLSDYDNAAFHGTPGAYLETNVYQQQSVGAADVGSNWTFTWEAKRDNLVAPARAFGFIRHFDSSFDIKQSITTEMTTVSTGSWSAASASIDLTTAVAGDIVQFGFNNLSGAAVPSAVLYDNVDFTPTPAAKNAQIELVWSGTTGAGDTGSPNISAKKDDELSLQVILRSQEINAAYVGVSLSFRSAPLELLSVTPGPDTVIGASLDSATVEANSTLPVDVLADLSVDNAVGLPDFLLLRKNFFGPGPVGDVNGDGVVAFPDLAVFSTAFGTGSTIAASSSNVLFLGGVDFSPAILNSGEVLLATLVFKVTENGSGSVIPRFNPGIDGAFDAATFQPLDTSLSRATIFPPSMAVPFTGALGAMILGMSLVGLGFVRSRRTFGPDNNIGIDN